MTHVRMLRHIADFPTLFDYTSGVHQFSPSHFLDWLETKRPLSNGTMEAAAWIMHLWTRGEARVYGREGARFDLRYAWQSWDEEHRAAWRRWATEPFFP